jgi:hypothetical protein
MNHNTYVRPLAGVGNGKEDEAHEVTCESCNWTFVATNARFAGAVATRHKQLNQQK